MLVHGEDVAVYPPDREAGWFQQQGRRVRARRQSQNVESGVRESGERPDGVGTGTDHQRRVAELLDVAGHRSVEHEVEPLDARLLA